MAVSTKPPSSPKQRTQGKPPRPPRRNHPVRLLYLFLVPLLLSLLQGIVQTLITNGLPGLIDLAALKQIYIVQLAVQYPAIVAPGIIACIILAVIGWHMDKKVQIHEEHQKELQMRQLAREEHDARSIIELPLVRDLKADSLKMGDTRAATFPYVRAPIQVQYDTTIALLQNAIAGRGKRGVLIMGEANAGKTRLAYEVLVHTVPDWQVLRWSAGSQPITVKDLPSGDLALFIDDVQDFSSIVGESRDMGVQIATDSKSQELRSLVEALIQRTTPSQRLIIVATGRLEREKPISAGLGWLVELLTRVQLPTFNTNETDPQSQGIIEAFAHEGEINRQEWDGTLGSLVLGLVRKRAEYELLGTSPPAIILHAMKLLTLAGTQRHTEQHLRAVAAGVFGVMALRDDVALWRNSVAQLRDLAFITDEHTPDGRQLVIRKDTYFEKVVMDYPVDNQERDRDMDTLAYVLSTIQDKDGLFNLGYTLDDLKRYDEAMVCYDQVLTIDPTNASAWYSKGFTLVNLERYEESIACFDQTLAIDPIFEYTEYNKC